MRRRQVYTLLRDCPGRARMRARQREQERTVNALAQRSPPRLRLRPTRRRELQLWRQGYRLVAGVDEVGRGALAGPVVAGAVILPPDSRPAWLAHVRDSKQLTPPERGRLAPLIQAEAVACGIGWVAATEIDALGIGAATRLAMRRALVACGLSPQFVLIDGNAPPRLPWPVQAVVAGDATVASIAAASVIAKVARDHWMQALHLQLPDYDFAANKGYGTVAHLAALQRQGPCAEHRYSFAPVRAADSSALYRSNEVPPVALSIPR